MALVPSASCARRVSLVLPRALIAHAQSMGLRWFASRAGLPAPWLRGFDDTELTLVAGALLALALLLLAVAILAARTCRARCCAAAGPSSEMAARGLGRVAEEEPANAEDYAKLQVCVRGADEMAELEVETDGFETDGFESALGSARASVASASSALDGAPPALSFDASVGVVVGATRAPGGAPPVGRSIPILIVDDDDASERAASAAAADDDDPRADAAAAAAAAAAWALARDAAAAAAAADAARRAP